MLPSHNILRHQVNVPVYILCDRHKVARAVLLRGLADAQDIAAKRHRCSPTGCGSVAALWRGAK